MKHALFCFLLVGSCIPILAQPISRQEVSLFYERPPLEYLSDQVRSAFFEVKVQGGAHYSHGTKKIYIAEPVFSKSFPDGSREYDLVERTEAYVEKYLQPEGVRQVESASEADMTIRLSFGLIKVHEYKSPQVAQHHYRFSLPARVEPLDRSGKTLLSEDVYPAERAFQKTVSTSKTYIPKAGSDVATVLLCQDIVPDVFAQAGDLIKKHFFHSTVKRTFPLFGVNADLMVFGKKKYQNLFDAEAAMLRAVDAWKQGGAFEADLKEVRGLWEKELEAAVTDKKSVVTPKLREDILYNLALSYWFSGQPQEGLSILDEKVLTGEFGSEAFALKQFLEETAARSGH